MPEQDAEQYIEGDDPSIPLREQPESPLWTIWEFVVHGMVGFCIFAIIAVLAIPATMLTRWMEIKAVPADVLVALKFAERALLWTDIGLFIVFLTKTAVVAIIRFWRELKGL